MFRSTFHLFLLFLPFLTFVAFFSLRTALHILKERYLLPFVLLVRRYAYLRTSTCFAWFNRSPCFLHKYLYVRKIPSSFLRPISRHCRYVRFCFTAPNGRVMTTRPLRIRIPRKPGKRAQYYRGFPIPLQSDSTTPGFHPAECSSGRLRPSRHASHSFWKTFRL